MSAEVFHKQNVTVETKGRESFSFSLEKKSTKDIFKFGQQVYVCIGASNSGKTTIVKDIFANYSSEYTCAYYITATDMDVGNEYLGIPIMSIRKPTAESIYSVWQQCKTMCEHMKYKPSDLTKICCTLFGQDQITNLVRKIESERNERIDRRFKELHTKFHLSQENAAEQAEWEQKAYECQIFTTLIGDGMNDPSKVEKLDNNDILTANSIISEKPRIILILDDVTSEISTVSNQMSVRYGKKEKELMSEFLTDLLTKARHYNMLACMFVHDISFIGSYKNMINNLVILDKNSATKLSNQKNIDEKVRNTIVKTYDIIDKYPYHYLFLKTDCNSSNDIAVGCAKLHVREKLQLSNINTKAEELYKQVLSNLAPAQMANDDSSDDYASEDSGSGEDVDDADGDGGEYDDDGDGDDEMYK